MEAESRRGYPARNSAGRFVGKVVQRLNPTPDGELSARQQDWLEAVEEARNEWQKARVYFENVSDPKLVDHAVHLLTAAEKKYTYLLSQIRGELSDPSGEEGTG